MSAKKKWFSFNFNPDQAKSQSKTASKNTLFAEKKGVAPLKTTVKSLKGFKFFDELEPKCVEDLAVHPKKVADLKAWLQDYIVKPINKQNVPILLITGPTGCGKTTTFKLLCQQLGIDVQEWINPVDGNYELYKGPGQVSRFSEFLREAKYPSLFSKVSSKVALVEDFPNILLNNAQEFDEILDNCVSNRTSPIVFICTDVHSSSINITKNLFTDEIRMKYNIHNISFNACSATLLKVALKRAQTVVQKHLDVLQMPAGGITDAIIVSTMGDVRCAVNQYYFAALKGTGDLPTELLKREVPKPGMKRKRNEKNACVKIMAKDESLGLFHSLGRVLNPKWTESNGVRRLHCDLDALIDEFSTQPSIFNAFLQENYVKYFGDVDDVCRASDVLSLSQTFMEKWTERHDTLVFAMWISVLGLMVFNEHRVAKWTQITGPKKINIVRQNRDLATNGLDVTDYNYYNLIKGGDTFHKFTYCK